MNRKCHYYIFFICILTLLFSACSTVPYTERKQLILIPEGQESSLGQQAFTQVVQENKISNDPHYNEMLRSVGERISQAANRPDYQWEFVVIDDPNTVNAFALPGGKVAFYTGIMPICQNEEGIAVVMGHEVSHALARHGAERMSQGMLAQLGEQGLNMAVSSQSPMMQGIIAKAYGFGVQYGALLPYSRLQESEADRLGIILMAQAGYDPKAAVSFWKRMSEQAKGKKPMEFLSTHPSDEKRIQQIKEWLPEAYKYYYKQGEEGTSIGSKKGNSSSHSK
ncbi:MAG: M48 family metallopeptidase [Candidatus Brocadiaceae bacterium]